MKSDQEPSLRWIVDEVGRLRVSDGSGRYVVEYSLVGASQSNGMFERAISLCQGKRGCFSVHWKRSGFASSRTITH